MYVDSQFVTHGNILHKNVLNVVMEAPVHQRVLINLKNVSTSNCKILFGNMYKNGFRHAALLKFVMDVNQIYVTNSSPTLTIPFTIDLRFPSSALASSPGILPGNNTTGMVHSNMVAPMIMNPSHHAPTHLGSF